MNSVTVKEFNIEKVFFADDGLVPNSHLPVLLYKNILDYGTLSSDDAKQKVSEIVKENEWYLDWAWYVYPFLHYHSTAHEGLIVFSGKATIKLGGDSLGKSFKVEAGDMVIIPAGVGHERLEASDDFYVFGIYPNGQKWDFISEDKDVDGKDINDLNVRKAAIDNIKKLGAPLFDPVYKNEGLKNMW